jgi:hypothetical protein
MEDIGFKYTSQTVTHTDFDSALYYAKQLGRLSLQILTWLQSVNDGVRYESTEGDVADLIAGKVQLIEQYRPFALPAISKCRELLAIQNDRLTEGRFEPKPLFNDEHYGSAHEVLAAVGLSLASAVRAWDHPLGDSITFDHPVDVEGFRSNLSEASHEILTRQFTIPQSTIKSLIADAEWESRQAKLAMPAVVNGEACFETSTSSSTKDSSNEPRKTVNAIPAEYRTVAMPKSKAAGYLRPGNRKSAVRWLSQCIEDGTISCESLSPNSHVFDIRQFPVTVHASIRPASQSG